MITITSMVKNMNGFFQLKQSEEALVKASENLVSLQQLFAERNRASSASPSPLAQSNIRKQNQSIQDVNNAVSLNQVTDNAIGSAAELLLKMKDVAIKANNVELSEDERNAIKKDVSQLAEQLSEIGNKTTFNGINVFDNSQSLTIQIGFNNSISLNMDDIDSGGSNNADNLIKHIDDALNQINTTRSRLTTQQSSFGEAIEGLNAQFMQQDQISSSLKTAEHAQTLTEFLQEKLATQTSSSSLLNTSKGDRAYISALLVKAF